MSEVVQYVVGALNESPFNKGLTLVSFDKKTPQELIQILQSVLEEISTEQKVNFKQETPDVTAQRMFDFLWILKYKSHVGDPFMFRNGLMEGDRKVVYPILLWLLQKIPELRRRAYLAKFLLGVEVPPDMTEDEAYLEFKQKQEDFKELHKEVEKIRGSGFQPAELKTKLSELERQKEKLNDKLVVAKKKLERLPNRNQLLDAAREFRTEEEEKDTLAANLIEQQNQLAQKDSKLSLEASKLKEMQSTFSEGGIQAQIRKLQETVESNGYLVQMLPQERANQQQWADNLKKVLNDPPQSDQEKQRMMQQIAALRNDIKALTAKRDNAMNKVDDKLALYRSQFNAVDKKKKEKEQTMRDLMEERKELQNELAEKEAKLEELNPGKILRGEALDKYVQDLRKKTALYKKAKAEENSLKTEHGILNRTLEILQSKESKSKSVVDKIEESKGIKGYQSAQDRMENISQMKSDLDMEKGATLEEFSKVVTEINNNIKNQKAALAPQVKALRTLRAEYQELETEHSEKKSVFESATVGLQSDQERSENEKQTLQGETEREKSRYHYLHRMSMMMDMQMSKANMGNDGNGTNFKEIYERATAEQAAASKELREEQRKIKDTYEPNKLQIEMFSDLRKILKTKLKAQAVDDGILQSDEPDRLVL